MQMGGVDGCKAGWVLVSSSIETYSFGIYSSFHHLIVDNPQLKRILIDIPIGLSSVNFPRTIDPLIRKELGKRASTVFNAPCRSAVYEVNNLIAKNLNIRIENKSLSEQSLNIRHKIKEVDEYIRNSDGKKEIIESHPELCFKYLNDSNVLMTKKNSDSGISERLNNISKYDRRLLDIYYQMLTSIKRKDAKKDDLIDAICLCLVNKLGMEDELTFIKDKNNKDEHQIQMKVAYYRK